MLTIIITTFNRTNYLNRLLNYLSLYKVKYPLFIGDASESPHLENNKEIIDSFSRILNLRHLVWDSSVDNFEVMFGCLRQVKTDYVVFIADDDFVVPPSLDSAVEFLDKNPTYEAAQGRQMMFTTSSDGPYSASLKTAQLLTVDASVEGETAMERVWERMSQNTRLAAPKTPYSVMRTQNAIRLYKEVLALGLSHSNSEGLLARMMLLSGKIKLIDRLYIARQHHSSNFAYRAHVTYAPILTRSVTRKTYESLVDLRLDYKRSHPPDFFDQLTDPLFSIQCERMNACLVNELVRNDGVSIEEARKIIKHWQWYFLAKNMMPKFYEHGGGDYKQNTIGSRVMSILKYGKELARKIPGVKKVWWKLSGGRMSVAAMLNPNSPFHEDFMPIYRAVTTSPARLDMSHN